MGIAKKLGQLVATVLLVTLFSAFLLTLLPGDLADIIVPFGTDEQREQVREDLRLDAPFISQYGRWLSNFAQGDLGDFYSGPTSRRPVSETVKEALPKSIELMVWAQIIALVILVIIVTPRLVRPLAPGALVASPLDGAAAPNDVDLFLNGQTEISRANLRRVAENRAGVLRSGHVIDF